MANQPVQVVDFSCGHRRFYASHDFHAHTHRTPNWNPRTQRFDGFNDPLITATHSGGNAWTSSNDCCACLYGVAPLEMEPIKKPRGRFGFGSLGLLSVMAAALVPPRRGR